MVTRSPSGDFPYYRHLWKRVICLLALCAFLPLILVGGALYIYETHSRKQQIISARKSDVLRQREHIDMFLMERTRDLGIIAKMIGHSRNPEKIKALLAALHQNLPYFQDIELIDEQGHCIAYTGPHDRSDINHSKSPWFQKALVNKTHISDVFKEFRCSPHFVIALRQNQGAKIWILKATIMSTYFNNIVIQAADRPGTDAYLINTRGILQTDTGKRGLPMEPSGLDPGKRFKGIHMENEKKTLVFSTWLDTLPWVSVVTMEKKEIFKDTQTIRNISLIALFLCGVIIIMAVLFTTDKLIFILENQRLSHNLTGKHVNGTAFLAACTTIAQGVFSHMNDILSNIHVTTALAKENAKTKDEHHLLEQISLESIRGKKLIDEFQEFIRPRDPVIMMVDVHPILKNILGFMDNSTIRIIADFPREPAWISTSKELLTRIFSLILLNAHAVTKTGGTLWINTSQDKFNLTIEIIDGGPHLSAMDRIKIFNPDQVSHRRDSGFNLFVAQKMMEDIKGKINVENHGDKGVSFSLILPLRFCGTPERTPKC